MSNYRDDTQETAVASDGTWLGLSAITEEGAKIAGVFLFGLMVMHQDQATASDEVIDQASHVVVETAIAGDEVQDALAAGVRVDDQARVIEAWTERLGVLHEDQASVTDAVIERFGAAVTERAYVSDEVSGQRFATSLVVESAQASDFSGLFTQDVIEDAATASDHASGVLAAADLFHDAASAADEDLSRHAGKPLAVAEQARVDAEVIDALQAHDLVVEMAVVEDATLGGDTAGGQAWTANVDSWAMSRYAPYGFRRLAVIDGVPYGEADDGVYALSGGQEPIAGKLVTGKLDLGQGQLVHPIAAYLEYQLTGSAEMDVTTTQSGTPETYTYMLPEESAEHLTNGRFIFGRGLRGRHFSFTLRMDGEQGAINDMSVDLAPTKRRV